MHPKHVYRVGALSGTLTLSAFAFLVANAPAVQGALTVHVPFVSGLHPVSLAGGERRAALAMTSVVTAAAALPLCKPQPRRILDTITGTLRALSVVVLVAATVGYFDYTYRLPRTTLLLSVGLLSVVLPAWFVWLQERQLKRTGRTLIVGNSPRRIGAAIKAASDPIAGYTLSPPRSGDDDDKRIGTDGGRAEVPAALSDHECLGGLSRLDGILRQSNIGTVVPVFPRTDRAEFFGVLDTCHRHGVDVEMLDGHGEGVLVDERGVTPRDTPTLVRIDLEPWDLQTRLSKRLFDVCFAGVGLACALPLIPLVAGAVKLDGPGPVFYTQERTTQFGETFSVYKFRSMRPESESPAPGEDDGRVTRVGRVLRRTHLDELPQLASILTGRMSVVGPRAAWTAEERLLREETRTWQKRWFVRPGLTGLAQINGVSSEDSETKLQYDLAYIRRQSFAFDLKIVVRQFWMVFTDAASLCIAGVRSRAGAGSDEE